MLHFTVDDGLPSNTIYSVFKDSKGYLWFASDNGIARYNGIKYEKFTTDDGLSDNDVFYFKEDLSGRLWMSTNNGKLCYYKDGIFHNEKNDNTLRLPFKEPYLLSIAPEKDTSVTMFFNDRTKFITFQHNKFKTYDLSRLDSLHKPVYLIEIHKLNSFSYQLLYKDIKVTIDTNLNILHKEQYPGGIFFNPYRDRVFNFLYTRESIYSPDQKMLFSFKRGFDKTALYYIYESNNNYFLCTDHGLYINNDRNYLQGNNVTAIVQDEEGNYWVSTLKNGVYYFDKNFLKQQVYKANRPDEVKFSAFVDSAIFFSNIANDFYRLRDQKVVCIYHEKKNVQQNKYAYISGFDIDDRGYYHSFYNHDEILIKDINSKNPIVSRTTNKYDYGIKTLHAIGNKVYILMPTFLGCIHYDRFGKRIDFVHIEDFKIRQWPFSMTKSSDNHIWYSTLNKVYKITDDKPVLQTQLKNITFKWFSVYDDYLVGCSIDNKLIICNHPDGNAIYSSVTNEQCVWGKSYLLDKTHVIISTNTLYRVLTLKPSADTPCYFITVLENPIVPKNAENICSDNTNCYFFKSGSISMFPISDLLVKPHAPKIFFTNLQAGNTVHSLNGPAITLPYASSRNIRIFFASLTYSSKDLVYEYTISRSGEDNWMSIKAQEINLVNAGFGNYVIRLRSRTLESGYSDVAILWLTIEQPWWATWWFISASVVLLMLITAVIIYAGVRRTIKKRDKAHLIKIDLLRSEYKAMNALMNPHLIFNVLNNVQGLIDDDDKKKAKEYLQIFSLLMRQNMHNISREMIPLQKEIELLNNYLKIEKLRFKEWLNYSLYVDENVDTNDILIPPLLIQPLVENAILHGLLPAQSDEAFVSIRIFIAGNDLVLEIKDNGIGINRSKETNNNLQESFGLENVRKRISQLSVIQNKDISFSIREISDEHSHIQGTVATIKMQL